MKPIIFLHSTTRNPYEVVLSVNRKRHIYRMNGEFHQRKYLWIRKKGGELKGLNYLKKSAKERRI